MKVAEIAPLASGLGQIGQWVVADPAVNLRCAEFATNVLVRLKCLKSLQQAADWLKSVAARQSKLAGKRK